MPRSAHWGKYFSRYHGATELKEIIKKVYQLSFFIQMVQTGQRVKFVNINITKFYVTLQIIV